MEVVFPGMISRRREEPGHGKSIGKNRAAHQCAKAFRYFGALWSMVKTNSPKASGTWKFGAAVPVGLHAA
jgi:hypothetical protein